MKPVDEGFARECRAIGDGEEFPPWLAVLAAAPWLAAWTGFDVLEWLLLADWW